MSRGLERRRAPVVRLALTVCALYAGACTGLVADPAPDSQGSPSAPGGPGTSSGGSTGGGGGSVTELPEFSAAPGAFKRLTASEYLATVRALLGDVTIGDLEPDTFVEGFAKVGSSKVSISLNGVEKYERAAEAATSQVFADAARRSAFVGCTPSGTSDSACFESFVTRFGRLAFRRPLSDAERERYTTLASTIATKLGDPVAGLKLTTKALLLSPYFLYRIERGTPDESSGFWRLTSHEVAANLSYFLTNSSPDAELLDAADRDELSTVTGLRAHAERLLALPEGREAVANFATELFRLALIADRAKDPGLFPEYVAPLQDAMAREIPAVLEHLVFDRRASALEIFTTRTTFANAELALLYGLDASGLTSSSWQKVELPAEGLRAGLLGTGAFLSLNANQKEGSPTHRGRFIREHLLCQEIPDPPPDVSTVIEDPPPGVVLTKREKLDAHRNKVACAGCHALMDPLGLTLENFDAIGKFRETEQGLSIDVSGDFDGVPFQGPLELGKLLAENPLTTECLVKNVYRYATGRTWSDSQARVVAALVERFTAEGHDFQKLMIELVTSDGFRFVAPPQ
jgi:hypothetical protein